MKIQKPAEQKTYKTHGQNGKEGNCFPKKKTMDEGIASTKFHKFCAHWKFDRISNTKTKPDAARKEEKYEVPLYDCYD